MTLHQRYQGLAYEIARVVRSKPSFFRTLNLARLGKAHGESDNVP
jgi:hypothetical protein